MNKQEKYLAIIPARGGSKRLPQKNILELDGKPLISYTIEAALGSSKLDNIIVTSEDEDILSIASKYDVELFKRPSKYALDNSSTIDTITNVINNIDKKFEYIILLQPTSPLRTNKHIDEAIKLLEDKEADGIISVCEVDHPVQWSMTLPKNHNMDKFIANIDTSRSQDLPLNYRLNGAIYIAKTEKLLKQNTRFLKENMFAYIMDKSSSIDIDDKIDFYFAETILKKGLNN